MRVSGRASGLPLAVASGGFDLRILAVPHWSVIFARRAARPARHRRLRKFPCRPLSPPRPRAHEMARQVRALHAPGDRCRLETAWLVVWVVPGASSQAGLWMNLWMTCAYTPRICAQRGDNAVDSWQATRPSRPLPGKGRSTPCVHGEIELFPQGWLHESIRRAENLSEVYQNVICWENGGD